MEHLKHNFRTSASNVLGTNHEIKPSSWDVEQGFETSKETTVTACIKLKSIGGGPLYEPK